MKKRIEEFTARELLPLFHREMGQVEGMQAVLDYIKANLALSGSSNRKRTREEKIEALDNLSAIAIYPKLGIISDEQIDGMCLLFNISLEVEE